MGAAGRTLPSLGFGPVFGIWTRMSLDMLVPRLPCSFQPARPLPRQADLWALLTFTNSQGWALLTGSIGDSPKMLKSPRAPSSLLDHIQISRPP